MSTAVKDNRYWIKWGVTFLIPIICLLIPANGVYSWDVKWFCAVTSFGILTMCFELVQGVVAAMFLMLGYYLSGIATFDVAFGGFTNSNCYIAFGILLLVSVLQRTGALKRMAYLIMTKFGGSYFSLCVGMFFVCLALCIITFGTAGFIVGAIAYGLCVSINADKKAAAGIGLIACIVTIGGRGIFLSPMYLAPLMGAADDYLGYTALTYGKYFLHNWPYLLVLIVMTLLISKMYKPATGVASREHFKEEYKKLGKTSKDEKKVYVLLIVLFVYFFAAPRLWGLDANLGFIVLPWLCYLPFVKLADAENLKDINYGTVFFIVACFGIGNVATQLGIGEIVAELVLPYVSQVGTFGAGGLIFVLSLLLNFAMTPYAIEACVTIPFTDIVMGLGLDPNFAYNLMALGMDQLLFPYEYTDYLVVFSFGLMSMKDFIKVNGIKMIISLIFIFVILMPYWMLIGLI